MYAYIISFVNNEERTTCNCSEDYIATYLMQFMCPCLIFREANEQWQTNKTDPKFSNGLSLVTSTNWVTMRILLTFTHVNLIIDLFVGNDLILKELLVSFTLGAIPGVYKLLFRDVSLS